MSLLVTFSCTIENLMYISSYILRIIRCVHSALDLTWARFVGSSCSSTGVILEVNSCQSNV